MQYQIGQITLAHEDPRRTISEMNGKDFSIQAFVIHASGLALGNHYHKKKAEIFVITGGKGSVILSEITDEGQPKNPETFPLQQGTVVQIPPRVAHTFLLDGGSTMVCFCNIPFDPQDKDMHSCQLA